MDELRSGISCSLNLKRPLTLALDCSSLCVDVDSNGGVYIGHEKGLYKSTFSDGKIFEVAYLQGDEVPSLCCSKTQPFVFYAASKAMVSCFDERVHTNCPVFALDCGDDVNGIALNSDESRLASCNDAGDCYVFDLKGRKVFRTLRQKHSNICSSVAFLSDRPTEIITAGLDCQIIHWDFTRVKLLQVLNSQDLLSSQGDSSVYMFNPPLVHALDISFHDSLAACALGNGSVQIFQLRKGKRLLFPSYILNKHSTLGASAVHFSTFQLSPDEPLLVSGGNDGFVHVWNLPSGHEIDKKRAAAKVQSANKLCSEEETSRMLSASFALPGKVNYLRSAIIGGRRYILVCDTSNTVKAFSLDALQ